LGKESNGETTSPVGGGNDRENELDAQLQNGIRRAAKFSETISTSIQELVVNIHEGYAALHNSFKANIEAKMKNQETSITE
jgi:hypothetical protein